MSEQSGKHKTIPKELKPHVAWLRSLELVTKVVCGRVENCRTKYPCGYLALRGDEPVGFKVRGYFGSGVMDFYVYLSAPDKREEVKNLVLERFCKVEDEVTLDSGR